MKQLTFVLLLGALVPSFVLFASEKWVSGSDAIRVLGQSDFVTKDPELSQTGMNDPYDVVIDPTTGKVFVADSNHNRVLRYASYVHLTNGAPAEIALGQSNFTSATGTAGMTGMFTPRGLAIQGDGTLWVADFKNHRILRFDNASSKLMGAAADGVLGQPDFDGDSAGLSQSETGFVRDVAVDANGNLFTAESANNRVLMWENAASLSAGANATKVFGQDDFDVNLAGSDDTGITAPAAVTVDAKGNLYVSDSGSNRVLRFNDPILKSNGAAADAVFGQADFMGSSSASTPTGLSAPQHIAVDAEGRLWVADSTNNRVIGFPNAATAGNGTTPDFVIGQPDLVSYDDGLSISALDFPYAVSFDPAGRLYVADNSNNRVLVFQKSTFQPDLTIGEKLNKQKGDQIYNATGAGQKQATKTDKREVGFVAIIQNDGNVSDSYSVSSAKSNSKIKVKVFRVTGGRANVTAAAKTGSHITTNVGSGGSVAYQLKGKPKGKYTRVRTNHTLWIQTHSTSAGDVDRVKGVVKNRPK